MTKSTFTTSLCKLPSPLKFIISHLDATHEDDNLEELAIQEDCYQPSNPGSGISPEISSTRKEISLFRDKSDSDARSEYDEYKPVPSEPSSEEGKSEFESESLNPDADNSSGLPAKDSSHVADEHSSVARLPTEKYENVSINSADIQSVVNQEDHNTIVENFGHSLHLSVSNAHDASRPSALQNSPCNNKQFPESLDKALSGVDRRIFVMGGYDGVSWLPTMDCYIPSGDIVQSFQPMSFIRSNAGAAVLNDHIYNVGGWNGYDGLWHDTVECYSPLSKQWIPCPLLKEKKGGLACAALSNKVFAIGGGNGVDCFRAVEMFEPVLSKWIPAQSMLQKRFASAAVELDGVLYVVGGYDGRNYLKSAERFDPREFKWSKLQSLCTSRGSHALTVFQGKLYAMGGHDGTCYLPSVEIFEPRKGSWVPGDEMKVPRGHFVAPVIGDAIYAIGGQTEGNYILDWVETYRLDRGWSITKLKGIGASRNSDEELLIMVRNLPQVRHLCLVGFLITIKELQTILDGVPHLEHLDLEQCRTTLRKENLFKGHATKITSGVPTFDCVSQAQ